MRAVQKDRPFAFQAASSERPLWVISGHTDKSAPCPLYLPSRRWLNALFRVVLDTIDRAVDRVGFHMRPLPCDGLLMQVSQS